MDKRWTFVAIGIGFWIVGALAIGWLGPLVFDGGVRHVLFFLVNFAVAPVSLLLFARLTGRTRHRMLVPTAVMAMPAMLLDGVVVSLDIAGATGVYSDVPMLAGYSGGLLLFAFWSFFFWALLWHREAGWAS